MLRNVDLSVPTGSVFGFLGPNGAGKSTTIRILLGLLRGSSGVANVLGRDAHSDGPRLRAQIGYLPGDVRFYPGLTGRRTLDFLAAVRKNDAVDEIQRLAKRLDLDLSKRVRDYSRGMKQKLGLIQALMHRPQLLILDEPTIALDPLVREALFDELRAVAADSRTVLFSSHTLSEVDALCDRVAILRNGRVVEQDDVRALRGRALRRVELVFSSDRPAPPPPNGLRVTRRHRRRMSATWRGDIHDLLAWLERCVLRDVSIAPPDLEDLFMSYYADAGGEAGA